MRNTYEITLVATDNGDPAQTTSATVQININDINEFTPQFSQSVYNISGLALNDTLPGVCMHVYVCVRICVNVCVCMYIRIYMCNVYICAILYVHAHSLYLCMNICIACMCVCASAHVKNRCNATTIITFLQEEYMLVIYQQQTEMVSTI